MHRGAGLARKSILRKTMHDGASWEEDSGVCYERFVNAVAVSKKKKYKPKRIGTKAVKSAELFQDVGDILSDTQATAFRALAARANYVALHRPETSLIVRRNFAEPLRNRNHATWRI